MVIRQITGLNSSHSNLTSFRFPIFKEIIQKPFMINFFRKTRKKMADDNPPDGRAGKPMKYLRYAIGEIVLVVVGILIALQINTWNEERKESVQENQLLKELSLNLQSNIEEFNKNINFQNSSIQGIDILLGHLESDKPYHDSLSFYFRGLIYLEQIVVSRSAYETLKSVGLKNIRSDSLRREIIDLFEMTYPNIVNLIRDVAMQRYGAKQTNIDKYFRTNRELEAVPIDYEALKQNQEFINWIYNLRSWKNAVRQMNGDLIDPTETLIDHINNLTISKN